MVLVTEGLGSHPFHGRIVILVNEYTHSAAEMVAALQSKNASPQSSAREPQVKVSAGTLARRRIEDTGVGPNVQVENSAESSAAGFDSQLQRRSDAVKTL